MSATKSRRKGLVAAQRAADRRRRRILVSAAVAILVLFATVIGVSLYRGQQTAGNAASVPPGATEQGISVGNPNAPVALDVYEDFQCPVCKQFEAITGPTIDELVRAGTVRVVYHPVAFLNQMSSTNYSTRASAAAGCAGAGIYPKFAAQLFALQPPEGGNGLPDDTLIAIGHAAGAGASFDSCVRERTYAGWSAQLTDTASRQGVTGTPTVLVNGHQLQDRTPNGLRAAVTAAQPR